MKDLIERLQTATGPDRELDAEIGTLVGFVPKEKKHYRRGRYPLQLLRVEKLWPAYTASIDAAITLVPEHCSFAVRFNVRSEAMVYGQGAGENADAPTPALALCIAALKARTPHP